MNNLFSAMQVAYDVEKDRHFVLQRALAILFALGALGAGLVVLLALIFAPIVASELGLGAASSFLITWGRWPLLVAIVFASLLLVYRFGIRRRVVRGDLSCGERCSAPASRSSLPPASPSTSPTSPTTVSSTER